MPPSGPAPDFHGVRARMRRQLARRFLLRGHMSLILAVLVRADPAARKLLLVPRFASLPAWRLLAVAAAYLV